MSYADRVSRAFSADGRSPDENRNDAIEYLKALRDTWKDISASLNRTLFIMLGLAAVFELIIAGGSKQVNVAGFTFEDLATIQATLPVLVAYLYLEVILSWMRYDDMFALHARVMEIVYPSVEANDLDVPLSPPSLALLRSARVVNFSLPSHSRRFALPMGMLITVTLLLPIGFEIHAYYVIFRSLGSTPLNWIGFVVALALVLVALTTFFVWLAADDENEPLSSENAEERGPVN